MLRLKTFGGLSIHTDAGPPVGAAAQRRRLALLALLAGAGERGLSRDKILGYLWPEGDPDKARRVLAQALYALRRDLGADELFLGTTEIRLNPDVMRSDRTEFCERVAAGRLAEAVALYEGPFLDGFFVGDAPEFERWMETERTNLAHDYIASLEKLAQRSMAEGDLRGAVGWWRRLAAADPLNARVALGLMRALVAAGDRSGALQHARIYETLLKQELEVSPDPEVTAFAERLRQEPTPVLVPASVPVRQATVPAAVVRAPPAPPVARPEPPRSDPAPSIVPAYHEEDSHSLGYTDEYARPRPLPDPLAVPPTRPPVSYSPASLEPRTFPAAGSRSVALRKRWALLLGLCAGSALVLIAIVLLRRTWHPPAPVTPVVAVGRFHDYTRSDTSGMGAPLSDMLATNLARTPGLQVVSTARMYELLSQVGSPADPNGAIVRAARQAGATELVDGALYQIGQGRLRLDIRRVALSDGSVRQAYTVEGGDVFALVESGTRELLTHLGVRLPGTPLADVTTRSLVAYRLYEEGLRAYFVNGDARGARQLLDAALAEDSTFAMAAYYSAMLWDPDRSRMIPGLERALKLSTHASDREQLLIRGGWADKVDDTSRLAIAETLTVRYPAEPDGYLLLGHARIWDGDFLGALEPLRRVVEMDSLGLRTDPHAKSSPAHCLACDALAEIMGAYQFADSMGKAVEVGRKWTRTQPGSFVGWANLAGLLRDANRFEEALAANQTVASLVPHLDQAPFRAVLRLRAGDFANADQWLEGQAKDGDTAQRAFALEFLVNSLRMQGRLAEAMEKARALRALETTRYASGAAPYNALWQAAILFEQGKPANAAAIFDSITATQLGETPSRKARQRAWTQTLRASALAAAGDTAPLASIADSVQAWGRQSGYGRDRRLHHHVRALLLEARGQLEPATAEYRAAVFSPTIGYTRTNLGLARVLMRLNRPLEAVVPLHAALHGPIDGPDTYVTRTELFEALALAYDAAGKTDSAVANYRRILAAWKAADPSFTNRVQAAQLRLAVLTGERVK